MRKERPHKTPSEATRVRAQRAALLQLLAHASVDADGALARLVGVRITSTIRALSETEN